MKRVDRIQKECLVCNAPFEVIPSHSSRKTCSKPCGIISMARTLRDNPIIYKKTGIDVICPVCKSETYRYPSQIARGYIYCSKKCWYSVLGEKQKQNPLQIEHLKRIRGLRDYSDPVARKNHSDAAKKARREGKMKPRYGADSNLWRGGIATLQNIQRQTPEYKAWRTAVYTRDGFACILCDRTKNLHAHHIKSFSKFPDLRTVIDNGVTVCRGCHSNIHGRFIPNVGEVNKKKVKQTI